MAGYGFVGLWMGWFRFGWGQGAMAAAVVVEVGGRLTTWCCNVVIALCWKCVCSRDSLKIWAASGGLRVLGHVSCPTSHAVAHRRCRGVRIPGIPVPVPDQQGACMTKPSRQRGRQLLTTSKRRDSYLVILRPYIKPMYESNRTIGDFVSSGLLAGAVFKTNNLETTR